MIFYSSITFCLRKSAGAQRIWLCRTGNSVYPQIGNKNPDLIFFCKGHLVVSWAVVMQVMMCTHYREALQKNTALQQSSSSPKFTASRSAELKSALQIADAGSIPKPAVSAQCPCTYVRELLPAIFQNYPFHCFKKAKPLPAVFRRHDSREGRDCDLFLGSPWHTWCLVKRGENLFLLKNIIEITCSNTEFKAVPVSMQFFSLLQPAVHVEYNNLQTALNYQVKFESPE